MFRLFFVIVFITFFGCNKNNVYQDKSTNDVLFNQDKIYQKYQINLLELHNKIRVEKGYKPLVIDNNLCKYAEVHVKKMVEKNSFYHSNMSDLRKVNSGTNLVGENIAWGQDNEESVVNSWMWSPGHRWNILGTGYKKVGFGMTLDKNERKYWCTVFSD